MFVPLLLIEATHDRSVASDFMALEGEGAILRHRELMGATDPAMAADGTIRKAFGTSIDCNVVHGSDAPDTADKEITFFFKNTDLCAIT